MVQQMIVGQTGAPFAVYVTNEIDSSNQFRSELDLVFVLRGTANFLLHDTQYRLRSRDFIFANPYEVHGVTAVSDECCYVHLLIQESRLRYLFSSPDMLQFSWQESLNNRKEPLHREIAEALRIILLESSNRESGYIAKAYQQVIRILVALNQYCHRDFTKENGSKKSSNQRQKSCEIMDYINSHYMEQISLDTISKALYLSPPYISKIFKENFQIGVLEYTNRLRVQKAVFPLTHTNALISDVAEECGFTNAKTFSRIFQKEMGISPTDYRKQHGSEAAAPQPLFAPVSTEFIQLLDFGTEGDSYPAEPAAADNFSVVYDFTQPGDVRPSLPWDKVLYAGTADLLLQHTVRTAVTRAVKDFDVEYIRIMGTLSDQLQTYQEDDTGAPHYFWIQLDEVLHFITDLKVKPFIGLGYMPKQLAAAPTVSPFHWDANTSGPKSMEKWEAYLKAFLTHLVQLYSYQEVITWKFEFWNDPFLPNTFWAEGMHAFREFFLASYRAFRAVLPDGQFGSPGFIDYDGFQQAGSFLEFCHDNQVKFDFLCLHLFELTDPKNPGLEHLNDFLSHQRRTGHGAEFIRQSFLHFQSIARNAGYDIPIAITEWNVSPYFHDLSRDTAFMATYVLNTINRLPESVASISFWSLMDYTREHIPQQDMFSGELGQRTVNDLAKPAYLAFLLLKKMHGQILEQGECYCIAQSNRGYHIALFNPSFFNEDFLNGTSRPLARKDRYQIFEPVRPKNFLLDLTLQPGQYRVELHRLDRDHGSIYDGWIRMGAPEHIDSTSYQYLSKLAYPDMSIQYKNIHGNLVFTEQVPRHGILLLSLIRLCDE